MKIKFYLSLMLLLIFCISLAAQAPQVVWVSTYNQSVNGFDGTNDCVADNQGHLYAVGSTQNPDNSLDIVVLNYNTDNGDTIWTRKYNGTVNGNDEASGCVLDNSGNLFVVGYSSNGSNDDFLIIKYDAATGDTIWTRKYNGAANGNDRATDCSFDNAGNLYVTGISQNSTDNDFLTIKYNADSGDTVWSRKYNGFTSGDDEALGCTLDNSGNLFVTGYSFNGVDYNILTIKYSENGDTSWTRKSGNTLDSLRHPKTDCVSDNSGDVYVIGMCGINYNFQNRYSVITKYNSSGDLMWDKTYDGPSTYDQSLGCALDGAGALYISGTTYDTNDSTHDDCFTIKYNTIDGGILWTKRYVAGPSNSSYGISCAIDNSGYLYVTGQAETSNYIYESFTIKYENTVTSIREVTDEIPTVFSLYQNYPNPFNPNTTIVYQIPKAGLVTLKVYDVLGREVANLVNENEQPGTYRVEFDAEQLSSGIYFDEIREGNYIATRKMILLK